MEDYLIRQATLADVDFLVETIIQAEKSGTDKLGLSTLSGLTEQEVRTCLSAMLNEEIDGCELSISSFLLAFKQNEFVAAVAGWVEGKNDDALPSTILKANLFSYIFPTESLLQMNDKAEWLKEIQIGRGWHTLQIEYVFVKEEYRGQHLAMLLIGAHIERSIAIYPELKEVQVQLFETNKSALRSYEHAGFSVVKVCMSQNQELLNYIPACTKMLMQKSI